MLAISSTKRKMAAERVLVGGFSSGDRARWRIKPNRAKHYRPCSIETYRDSRLVTATLSDSLRDSDSDVY